MDLSETTPLLAPALPEASRASKKRLRRPKPLRSGDPCPQCGVGRLDYDGLLNLSCPACGYVASGSGGGCT